MNSIYYNRTIAFGRFRGMTGRELVYSKAGRSYVRWASRQRDIQVGYRVRRIAWSNGFTGA